MDPETQQIVLALMCTFFVMYHEELEEIIVLAYTKNISGVLKEHSLYIEEQTVLMNGMTQYTLKHH